MEKEPLQNPRNELSDDSIRHAILNAFKSHWLIPHSKIHVEVVSGHVILKGLVGWEYQKNKAIAVARNIKGVQNVTDKIALQADVEDELEKLAVEEGLRNNWALNTEHINVTVAGNTIHLAGTVSSLEQKQLAERIAWNVKGAWNVENNLVVDY